MASEELILQLVVQKCMPVLSYSLEVCGLPTKTLISLDSTMKCVLTLSPTIPLRLYTVPCRSNPPFLIFDIRALWRSVLSARAPECQKLTKRPCDCCVLCLRLKSSLCSCAHSISDMTSFSCRNQGRDSVCPML